MPASASARGWTRYVPVLSVHPILMNAKAWKRLVGMASNLAQMCADSEEAIGQRRTDAQMFAFEAI